MLVDALEPFGFGHVFPRGTLREPLAGWATGRRRDADASRAGRRRRTGARFARVRCATRPAAIWVEATYAPRALRVGRRPASSRCRIWRASASRPFAASAIRPGFATRWLDCGLRGGGAARVRRSLCLHADAMSRRWPAGPTGWTSRASCARRKDLVKIGDRWPAPSRFGPWQPAAKSWPGQERCSKPPCAAHRPRSARAADCYWSKSRLRRLSFARHEPAGNRPVDVDLPAPAPLAPGARVDRPASRASRARWSWSSPTTARPTRRPQIVREFAARVRFPRRLHDAPAHDVSARRAAATKASAPAAPPYLLFLDGDCILPRDHVRVHLRASQAGGRHGRRLLPPGRGDLASRVTTEVVRCGEFAAWAPPSELRRLRKLDRASRFYRLIRHPTKPKLIGNNVGIWRSDFERVNGYDENFRGLGLRRRRPAAPAARARASRSNRSCAGPTPIICGTRSTSRSRRSWKQGANVDYLLRKGRLTRCRNGLEKRSLDDIAIRVVGSASTAATRVAIRRRPLPLASESARPEVEILFLPGDGTLQRAGRLQRAGGLGRRGGPFAAGAASPRDDRTRAAGDLDGTAPFPLDEVRSGAGRRRLSFLPSIPHGRRARLNRYCRPGAACR